MTSKHAHIETCPGCNQTIITTTWHHGQHVHAALLRADPTHITPQTETACIILDRPTYNHYQNGNTHQLNQRDTTWHQWHHAGQPHHILPAHKCGTTLPGTPINLEPPKPASPDPNQPCPY